jgi:hypothetical protein
MVSLFTDPEARADSGETATIRLSPVGQKGFTRNCPM